MRATCTANETKTVTMSCPRCPPLELMEGDPEDTFYNFAAGVWAEMQRKGDACLVSSRIRSIAVRWDCNITTG